ncbi:MAG: TIGR04283 family arsenosugar biosynthesis glycosyltransferase, partial [Pseudomonadota bacterium]|nr:TIGR04283 family arsenosugar biosynthesis glycosyltransferase [Pseudomonadota bacterium]
MISVVIPTLNEARGLESLLPRLAREDEPAQIIVVDGSSADESAEVAGRLGAQVLSAPRGRGTQLHAGVRAARGEVLFFLHADTVFPPGGLSAINRALEGHPQAVGGNFRLLFDGDDAFDRWLEGFYAWIRSKGLYYGDSGIFIRRSSYERIGGIRALTLMEDFDLVRRMEADGPTLCIQDPPLMTSSRRFRGRHPVAIFLGWLKIHLLYACGMSPGR